MTLKNINWIFVSIILPIVLFGIGPWWGTLLSDKKELTYSLLAQRDISTDNILSKEWPDIKVSYQDKDLINGSLLTLSIINTGQIPIRREEFDSPLTIHFSDSSSLISQKVIEKSPENIVAHTKIVADGIVIEPLLLNPNDSITIQVLSAAPIDITDVTARVSGLTKSIVPAPQVTSGIYVKYTPPIGVDNNIDKTILEVPISAVIIVTIVLLSAAMFNLKKYEEKIKATQKFIHFSFSAILYGLCLIGMRIGIEYAQGRDISKVAQAAIIALCFTVAYGLADILKKKLIIIK